MNVSEKGSTQVRIAMVGAAGRMGIRIMQLLQADSRAVLTAAFDRPGHPLAGQDVGALIGSAATGVLLSDQIGNLSNVDAVIDFSTPSSTLNVAEVCAAKGIPLVIGTTGLEVEEKEQLQKLSKSAAILLSPNVSRAVNVLMALVKQAATLLPHADIEIVERHHKFKKDAPSGTALRLAEVVAGQIGVGPESYQHGREGITGERPAGQIGLHALRTGDNPGEHTVVFGLMGECIELSHRALNRDGFAGGAIDCAVWLAGRKPGWYGMNDVLGL
jgi:4-hydroxy-tetrahydrodipicolinate reductase